MNKQNELKQKWKCEIISKEFYSNCFIEALKAKIKHPFKVKILYIPKKLNEEGCPHFMWTDGTDDYEFGIDAYVKNILLFKGAIRARGLGYANAYNQKRKEFLSRHNNRRANDEMVD
jgi:hypothetical protein